MLRAVSVLRRSLAFASASAFVLGLGACGRGGGGGDDGGGDDDPDATADGPADAAIYEPPRSDLVPAVGGEDTFDVATWNIENFPAEAATPRLVADLITSLDLDLVAVEEIADVAAFDELLARLPEHDGILSSHTYGDGSYQKVGFIYRTGLVEVSGGALLFSSEGYDFPRPPLSVQVTVDGHAFTAIVVHLKAGVGSEERERRTAALAILDEHLRSIADGDGDPDVIVLGDFNQTRDRDDDAEVWGPIGATDRYQVLTDAAAAAGEVSYMPFGGRLIDHAVVDVGFELGEADVVIPRLDEEPIDYAEQVSDHRPVILRFDR
jgi:endonuclease/exonuclease/phosphatase family metal-dependent hydrolase